MLWNLWVCWMLGRAATALQAAANAPFAQQVPTAVMVQAAAAIAQPAATALQAAANAVHMLWGCPYGSGGDAYCMQRPLSSTHFLCQQCEVCLTGFSMIVQMHVAQNQGSCA